MEEAGSIELLTVDLVLSFAVIEALVLALCCRKAARGPAFAELVPNLTAGLCLMLALRSALQGHGWAGLALWLAAAGVAHGVDLWIRWRRSGAALAQPPAPWPPAVATPGYPVSAVPGVAALTLTDVAPVDAICRQPPPASRNLENLR